MLVFSTMIANQLEIKYFCCKEKGNFVQPKAIFVLGFGSHRGPSIYLQTFRQHFFNDDIKGPDLALKLLTSHYLSRDISVDNVGWKTTRSDYLYND